MHSLLNWSYSARSRSGEESWPRTAQETPIQRARRNHRFFPAPITPASEISLTSSLTAGGLSDFNHTSMLVPRNNLHCLSVSSALSEAVSTRRRPCSVIQSYQRTAVPVADLRPGQGRARAGWGSREEGERMIIPPASCPPSCEALMWSFSVRRSEASGSIPEVVRKRRHAGICSRC